MQGDSEKYFPQILRIFGLADSEKEVPKHIISQIWWWFPWEPKPSCFKGEKTRMLGLKIQTFIFFTGFGGPKVDGDESHGRTLKKIHQRKNKSKIGDMMGDFDKISNQSHTTPYGNIPWKIQVSWHRWNIPVSFAPSVAPCWLMA